MTNQALAAIQKDIAAYEKRKEELQQEILVVDEALHQLHSAAEALGTIGSLATNAVQAANYGVIRRKAAKELRAAILQRFEDAPNHTVAISELARQFSNHPSTRIKHLIHSLHADGRLEHPKNAAHGVYCLKGYADADIGLRFLLRDGSPSQNIYDAIDANTIRSQHFTTQDVYEWVVAEGHHTISRHHCSATMNYLCSKQFFVRISPGKFRWPTKANQNKRKSAVGNKQKGTTAAKKTRSTTAKKKKSRKK